MGINTDFTAVSRPSVVAIGSLLVFRSSVSMVMSFVASSDQLSSLITACLLSSSSYSIAIVSIWSLKAIRALGMGKYTN